MSKFAMGTYSGHQPRLGIWALTNARPESAKTIFPNMSDDDDDLPWVSAVAPTFIYIYIEREVRWPNGLIPFCITPRVNTPYGTLPWPPRTWPARRWSLVNGARLWISWQVHRRWNIDTPTTRNASGIPPSCYATPLTNGTARFGMLEETLRATCVVKTMSFNSTRMSMILRFNANVNQYQYKW